MAVVQISGLLYTGLPADTKPTTAAKGARYYQTDAGGTFIDKVYWFDGTTWLLDASGGAGGAGAVGPGESRPTVAVTIADGASLSDAADVRGYRVAAIIYPAGWDAAVTTFQASADGVTYNEVSDGYGPAALTIPTRTAAGYVGLTAEQQVALMAADYLKVRSGLVGSAVNQGGAVIVTLVLEPLGA